jgi:CRISPR-associated protein Csx14
MKTILLAVCGLSPQVITETLFALHQNGRTVDSIQVITTREGKEKIFGVLLSGGKGHYYQYLKEYGYDPQAIDFGPANIQVIAGEDGLEIPDILDEPHNEAFLRQCLELTFHFTRDPENTVYFSVAGGRKTMSACLTLAAQMYGRSRDRIYHVLVSPEFESNPDFFYPPRVSKAIELRDRQGQPYTKETRFAEITLVHLPFVSIREQLSGRFLKKPLDPATLMLSLVREEKNRLTVNLVQGKLVYRGMELDLMPARLALYAFFALRKKECNLPRENCRDCAECFVELQEVFKNQERISEIYRRLSGKKPFEEMSDTGILNLNSDNFSMYKAKIRKELQNRFGLYSLRDLDIASAGQRPNTRYGIRLDKGRIEVVY